MILYKKEPRFDSHTGQPTEPASVFGCYICDYTGNIIVSPEPFKYNVGHEGIECAWGCCDLNEQWLYNHYDSDKIYEILATQPYTFGDYEWNGEPVTEILEEVKGKYFGSFFDIFRTTKARTLRRLLTEQKYTLEDLTL